MNHAISFELQFFLISVLWGAILLLVYDILRIFRRLIKHDSFFVAFEDLIFWVCASLFIFVMMYKENNGIIRGFSVMGMAIGMILYYYLLSDFLVNMITKLIRTLISPFVFAIKKIIQFIKMIVSRCKKVSNFIIRALKKWIKSVRIALNKRRVASAAKKQKHIEKKLLHKREKNQKKTDRKKLEENKKKNLDKSSKKRVSSEKRISNENRVSNENRKSNEKRKSNEHRASNENRKSNETRELNENRKSENNIKYSKSKKADHKKSLTRK